MVLANPTDVWLTSNKGRVLVLHIQELQWALNHLYV